MPRTGAPRGLNDAAATAWRRARAKVLQPAQVEPRRLDVEHRFVVDWAR